MKVFLLLTCLFFSSSLFAECITNANGKVTCSNGDKAVRVNPNTGTATTVQKNQNGVTTTQSSRGGSAKTKNGKGIYQSPDGTTCVKTANGKGCR